MTKKTGNAEILGAMIERLPPIGSVWPLEERALWLSAMEAVLHMVYGPVERIAIGDILSGAGLDGQMVTAQLVSSAEPTDKAMARDVVAAGGSREVAAETTEAPAKPEMGSEWSSSAETKLAPDPKVPPFSSDPLKKSVGGAPSRSGRPDDMPTNLECAIAGIKEMGPSSAVQLRNYVREKYWPGAPDHWAATLYDYVKAKKLRRDEDGKFDLLVAGEQPRPIADARRLTVQRVLPTTPVRAPMPATKPPVRAFKFTHGDKSVMLESAQQLSIVHRLQQALGQHVAEAFLAERVFGTNTERHRELVKAQALGLNGLLFDVGLKVMHYPGFGLIMKEVE